MAATASANLHRLADDVRLIPRAAMITAARAGKKIVQDHGARIAGVDGLKGKKKRGLKLRARDDIRDTATGATCRIQGSVPGFIWVNTGTAPHNIRRRKKGPMRKMTVHHPGTRGRHVWRDIADEVAAEIPDILIDAVRKAVARG
jgi:hypothetical protein